MVVAAPTHPCRVTQAHTDEMARRRRRIRTRTGPARGGPGLPVSVDWF